MVSKSANPTISVKETAGNKEGAFRANTDGVLLRTVGDYPLIFDTNQTEKARIDGSGRLMIGTTTEGHGNADELTISFNNTGVSGGDQGRCGMTIRSGDNTSGVTQNGYIYFSDGTSGANESKGVVAYEHSNDAMYFSTDQVARLRIDSSGHLLPGSDNAQNLGSSSKRWANLYTTDLNLSNEGKTNDVDGTWGDWTLQEGETKIFMINNRTGKKYSLKMEEE